MINSSSEGAHGGHIAKYRLLKVIGHGGQGIVYLAESPGGPHVALKKLHEHLCFDEGARRRFLAEAEAAKSVQPFCTAKVLDVGDDGDILYIVSEYVPGESLQKQIKDSGRIEDPGSLVRLAINMASGLAAIHAAKVVHRDFKPGNVLMGPDGPRIIDFGIARILEESSAPASGLIGTPAYMSPEQINGGRIGPASDMFSWGATLAFAATGVPIFVGDNGETFAAVSNRILRTEPDLSALPEAVRGLVAAALVKDPQQRISAKEALLQAVCWSAATGHKPDAPSGGTASDLSRVDQDGKDAVHPRGRRPLSGRGRAVALGAASLVVAVVAAWFLWPSQATSHRVCGKPAGGEQKKEPVGFVDHRCMDTLGISDLSAIMKKIENLNTEVQRSGLAFRKVVYFSPLTDPQGKQADQASYQQLNGVYLAQRSAFRNDTTPVLNQDPTKPEGMPFQVLFANATSKFTSGVAAAAEVESRVKADPRIVAVLGIGQSRRQSRQALENWSDHGLNLPVIATSVTGEDMLRQPGASDFFRISPGNAEQAKVAGRFAADNASRRRLPADPKIFVLSSDDPNDLFSRNLAGLFTQYAPQSAVITQCTYNESSGGSCLDGTQPTAQEICQKHPDLVFYASRATRLGGLLDSLRGCSNPPMVLGSSDVPKEIGANTITHGGKDGLLYYVTFTASKLGDCGTAAAHLYQTAAECTFVKDFRGFLSDRSSVGRADNSPSLAAETKDAMLGNDAFNTVEESVKYLIGVQGKLDRGAVLSAMSHISFDGASGHIAFPNGSHSPPGKPVFIVEYHTQTGALNNVLSCGRFSSTLVGISHCP